MIFYLIIFIIFVLDIINMHISSNHKDKIKYIIAMSLVGILGIFFLKFEDDIQIVPRVMNFINFYKGG